MDPERDRTFALDGRVALVTGATGYLGRAIVAGLARAGATVLVNGRRLDSVAQLVASVNEAGHKARAAVFDVREIGPVNALCAELVAGKTGLDILVNNAYAGAQGSVDTARPENFRDSFEVAVTSPFLLIQAMLPALEMAAARNGQASIVNIASMYGSVSPDPRLYGEIPPNPPFYGAAKGGLLQLTRYLACHLAARRIRVNAVSPGPFPAPSVAQTQPDFVARLAERVPLGRIGIANEVAGPVVFLASDAASYVTGANLAVDGGWTAW